MHRQLLNQFLGQYPDGICTITSENIGPTITVVAFTHGNEIAGMHVLNFLLNEYHLAKNIKKGKVQLIVGNIEAAKKNQRLVDKDINRLWDFTSTDNHTYEYKRAKELTKHLLESAAVLDIHSTSNPSEPMILPVSRHTFPLALRNTLHSNYVLYDILSLLHGKALVSFVQEQNPKAECFAIESGQHTSSATLNNAIENSLQFLGYYGVIPTQTHMPHAKKNLQVFRAIHAKTMDIKFLYNASPKSFDFIAAQSAIVHNGLETIYANENSYMIMPSQPKYIGEEIGYLAKQVD